MSDADIPTVAINDVLSTCYGNTLTGTFVAGNKIALSAYRPILSTTRDEPTEHAGKHPVYIQLVQEDFIFTEPVLRGLIAESNSTFVAVQGLKQSGSKSEYAKISRTYRSVIRACLEKLDNELRTAKSRDDTEAQTNFKEYITIFYSIECVWHLCEILLLDLNQTYQHTIVPKLLDWVRFHFPHAEVNATELMLLGHGASESDLYWPTLKSLILQGQLDVTRALLQVHPSSQSIEFKTTGDILKSLPRYHDGCPIHKFRTQWEYWLTETESTLASNILAAEPMLEELVRLVTGDTTTWQAQLNDARVWYEQLPGYLYFTNPACKYYELGDVANSWITRWTHYKSTSKNEMNHLDYILLYLMENNIKSALHAIQVMPDRQWFATHLIDLLYNSGQLKSLCEAEHIEYTKLRDTLLHEFGTCLMTNHSLWQLGMDYLEHCIEQHQAVLELVLPRIPVRNERQAFKIIEVAKKRKFDGVVAEICKVQSKRSFDACRYGNALEWALRAKDEGYITGIADFLLKHYVTSGVLLCPDVVANIGSKMFISSRLIFLVKYFDFYQYYRKRDFLPAAELLINLLESKLTPNYFWPSLLLDTIPLLESKDPKILSHETCSILHYLESDLIPQIESNRREEQQNPNAAQNVLKDYRIENVEELVSLLRLACARNLSRALIIEDTILN